MTAKAVVARRLAHRAEVVRSGADNSGSDWTERTSVPYADLKCLLLRAGAEATRSGDRALGEEEYRLLHLDGQIAINDKVTVSDRNGNLIRSDMFAGPTLRGRAYKITRLQDVSYGV